LIETILATLALFAEQVNKWAAIADITNNYSVTAAAVKSSPEKKRGANPPRSAPNPQTIVLHLSM
jgi:hypothetical protein